MEQTQKDNIIKKLIDTHTTVSTMESCTSGMIASTDHRYRRSICNLSGRICDISE